MQLYMLGLKPFYALCYAEAVGSKPTRTIVNINILNYALLAQSVEHQTFNLRVAGSSPAGGLVVV